MGSVAGQAAAETAVFGTLILLCFATLLTYGQRLEMQQNLKMEAFRLALMKAFQRNSSVSYTLKKDVRFSNILGNFGEGQPSSLSATASVMWQKGAAGQRGADDQASFGYYQINDDMIGSVDPDIGEQDVMLPRYDKESVGHDGSEHSSKVPVSIWKEESRKITNYETQNIKEDIEAENPFVRNAQTAYLTDTAITKLYTRQDNSISDARQDYVPPDYGNYTESPEYDQGAYYNPDNNRIEYGETDVGTTIKRQRTWETTWEQEE
ncbi:MAG: hypothetical protein ISS45_02295 [Candidatus Omnitrophica bacterium]|nr:hypothetical protein [Candidatus Omnitrophota bacterium]